VDTRLHAPATRGPASAAPRTHVVLATIEEGVRALAIRALGAYTESLGHRTTLLMIIRPLATAGHPLVFSNGEVRRLASFLKRERVSHLGFYLMTASLKPYARLAQALRDRGYGGVILAGGVHPTLSPAESLVAGADFAVQGPGELPLKQLLAGVAPESIPGLVWRRDGTVVANPQSPDQKLDLDSLPFPLFRFGADRVLYRGRLRPLTRAVQRRHAGWHGRYYDLITSRGCPYKCAYCCNVNRGPIRRASVEHVIRELKQVRDQCPDLAGVNIQDDAFFSGSEDWVADFCRRMKDEIGLPFIVRMIPRFATPERLVRFKDGGLRYVTMGLEGSARINRNVFSRPEDNRSFLKAAQAVLQAGLLLSVDIIVDNPYETEDDLREIALTLNALPRPNWWTVSLSLTPFPGTPLYARCVKDGMLERFATDAYDSMLMPFREGGYVTPRFWRLLNSQLLPLISPELGARLIAEGPSDPNAVRTVERLSAWMGRTRRATAWFRDHLPGLHGLTATLVRSLSSRARAHSDAMLMRAQG
jgi:radical SAM superfamily enzyme YgiQ (UPF0313 family)